MCSVLAKDSTVPLKEQGNHHNSAQPLMTPASASVGSLQDIFTFRVFFKSDFQVMRLISSLKIQVRIRN